MPAPLHTDLVMLARLLLGDVRARLGLDVCADGFGSAQIPACRDASELSAPARPARVDHDRRSARTSPASPRLIHPPCEHAAARHPRAARRASPRLVIVPVTDRYAIGVMLALRADNLVERLLQQLGQNTEPDLDRERQQSLPRCPCSRVCARARSSGRVFRRRTP